MSNFLQTNFTKRSRKSARARCFGANESRDEESGWGVVVLLLFPGCTSFIFLISGGGVGGVKTQPKDTEIRDGTWTIHQEEEEEAAGKGGEADWRFRSDLFETGSVLLWLFDPKQIYVFVQKRTCSQEKRAQVINSCGSSSSSVCNVNANRKLIEKNKNSLMIHSLCVKELHLSSPH